MGAAPAAARGDAADSGVLAMTPAVSIAAAAAEATAAAVAAAAAAAVIRAAAATAVAPLEAAAAAAAAPAAAVAAPATAAAVAVPAVAAAAPHERPLGRVNAQGQRALRSADAAGGRLHRGGKEGGGGGIVVVRNAPRATREARVNNNAAKTGRVNKPNERLDNNAREHHPYGKATRRSEAPFTHVPCNAREAGGPDSTPKP